MQSLSKYYFDTEIILNRKFQRYINKISLPGAGNFNKQSWHLTSLHFVHNKIQTHPRLTPIIFKPEAKRNSFVVVRDKYKEEQKNLFFSLKNEKF